MAPVGGGRSLARPQPLPTGAFMPTFLIEREIPGASRLTDDELRGITQTSNAAVDGLERPYTWCHSYVAGDKILGAAPSGERLPPHRAGRRRARPPADVASRGGRWKTPSMAIRHAGEVGTEPPATAPALLETLPVAVGCIDADEVVAYANGAFSAAV